MKAKNESSTRTILIAGVGGQGIILAGRVISEALVSVGFDVKMAEVLGWPSAGQCYNSDQIRTPGLLTYL